MEDAYITYGGRKLIGTIRLSGSKNVALKVIIASLLFDQEVTLKNVPRIIDVFELLDLIQSMGGKARFTQNNTVVIDGRTLRTNKVDLLHGSKIRVSFMLFAPLLYKFGNCFVPNPGGCRIGARPIDRIIDGMKAIGFQVEYNPNTGYYSAAISDKPRGGYTFSKPTHTGTELLILLSLLGKEKINLHNCAHEPEIDELVSFLNESGAHIQKTGSSYTVIPSKKLSRSTPFYIESDRNEAATFISLALATGGHVELSPIKPLYLETFLHKLRMVGATVWAKDEVIRVSFARPLEPSRIETSPHPGFMTDWQPNWAVLMTQATGESIIHERVFENRFSYVSELRKLGAEIDFIKIPVTNPVEYFFFNFDPAKKYQQAIRIRGPQKLHGGVLTVADLRAGATLLIAALTAQGESVIQGTSIIERGYENLVEKVNSLGGDIKKV